MTVARRWAIAAVLVSAVALSACSKPSTEDPDVPAPVPSRLDGTLYFLGSGEEQGGIWSLRGNLLSRRVAAESEAFFQTATVSPDGARFAFVEDGRLRVGELGRSGTTEVDSPDLEGDFVPQWTTDNAHLIVRYDGTRSGIIDISSGEVEPLADADEPYVAFSVDDGRYAVFGSPAREEWNVVEVGPDAAADPAIPVPFRRYSRFQSLAPDGRHAVTLLRGFTEPQGDATRTLEANAVVDLRTGTAQRVPGNGTVRQGFFRADGVAVLRVSEGIADRVLLVSAEGEVSDRVDLPRGVVDLFLLGYTPNAAPASPDPTTTPTAEPTEPEVALDGTLFFLGDGLHTLRDGTLTHVVSTTSRAFAETATVSPDGTRFAYIQARRLWVVPLDGTPAAVGPSTLDSGYVPSWSADGGSLLVKSLDDEFGYLDISSGDVTPLPAEHYFAVSADGTYAVVLEGSDVTIVRLAGDARPTPVAAFDDIQIARVQSLSPDGHHAFVLTVPDGTPVPEDRVLDANAIVDLTMGTVVTITGGTLREGFFQADGSLVLRVRVGGADRVVLISRMGEVQDSVDLPAEAADLALLGYAPAS